RYQWLADVRDANENRPGSADYDGRTLYIPQYAWKRFTPFEQQYWEVKKDLWDTIVFFKKGKFYELYENDARIGHQQFDLKLTDRVNMCMVGVPESSFGMWASQFVAKGYKVARVDQMETAVGKTMRERESTEKEDKVIKRQLTGILTAGTLVEEGMITADSATYCMSIKESNHQLMSLDGERLDIGVCFVDTSTATFHTCLIKNDDMERTQLETLLIQIMPRELVIEKNQLSKGTLKVIKNVLNMPIVNSLTPSKEFWDARTTEIELDTAGVFDNESDNSWPTVLEKCRQHTGNSLLMSAFGGLVSYLRTLKLDRELLSARNITEYHPMRSSGTLVLDGQTLANLEIFATSTGGVPNSGSSGGGMAERGTLAHLLNKCITPFGKRTLRKWICHPLCDINAINGRLDAVDDLRSNLELTETIQSTLYRLMDIERSISRIHAGRSPFKSFQETITNLRSLSGLFESCRAIHLDKLKSSKLQSLFSKFPDISSRLTFFENALIADTNGVSSEYGSGADGLIPAEGVSEEYDEVCIKLNELEAEFEEYLREQRKKFNCAKIEYKDLGKEPYQLDVPKTIKVNSSDYTIMSSTKASNRYWTPKLRRMVNQLAEIKELRQAAVRNVKSILYSKFDKEYTTWIKVVEMTSELDCLLSLSLASSAIGEPSCRPQFIDSDDTEHSVVDFVELRHPCVALANSGRNSDSFIPNDIQLGGLNNEKPRMILLTGPNMGGKSTLLRQTCIGIVMAQLGMYVPATECRLTPLDRIFTRIGAHDNIITGQSTFMIELAETNKILSSATPRSLVILDELGRGTSTYDGYAIACATLHELTTRTGCIGLFSTHYGLLTEEMMNDTTVRLMHMQCHVDELRGDVTFLYKVADGVCSKSYGMNVAGMAGVPRSVVVRATKAARDFEEKHNM
ncbi:hypothetical protein GQ42DRAFT_104655, partial [Ramicandelaber brevisporus]